MEGDSAILNVGSGGLNFGTTTRSTTRNLSAKKSGLATTSGGLGHRKFNICMIGLFLTFQLVSGFAAVALPPQTVHLSPTRPMDSMVQPTVAQNSETTTDPSVIADCPLRCKCTEPFKVDCSQANLTTVPANISSKTTHLDLSKNSISSLPPETFSNLEDLQELNLGSNNLTQLHRDVFSGLERLKTLSLHDNSFSLIPTDSFYHLSRLEALRLSGNQISNVTSDSVASLTNLVRLFLDQNRLSEVPVLALQSLDKLDVLNLATNQIRSLPGGAFRNLTKLVILFLKENKIDNVSDDAFAGLEDSLQILEINNNRLRGIPGKAIRGLRALRELTFASNYIHTLHDGDFETNQQLAVVDVSGNPISSVGRKTFSHLPNLKKLTLSDVRHLEEFLDLEGTTALEHLRLDRGKIKSVPHDLCSNVPHLKSLNLKLNEIYNLPNLTGCTQLRLLDLSSNYISELNGSPFKYQGELIDLMLSNNRVRQVKDETLIGLKKLLVLDLHNNRIESISSEAFVPTKELRDLNLAMNVFSSLPTKGLQNLRQLTTYKTYTLTEFPTPEAFPKIHSLHLSYAYHCCAFQPLVNKPVAGPAAMQETIYWLHHSDVDMSLWNTNYTDFWPEHKNFSDKYGQVLSAYGRDYMIPDNFANLAQYAEEYFEDYKSVYNSEENLRARHPVQCRPEPGPFMPCEDLFGWWTLRCGVWVVFLLAMLGNGIVVVVLLFGRTKIDVPRFLVCNLAMADFFMGIYLGILAVVDASTLGEFKVFAIQWQYSAGCQIAGFLGVLSSELSVYTLSVITLERNYAITHAMHLNKRLSLKHAGYIMSCGWTFALVMSILPLLGVSDYRKFAVCLPFDVHDSGSLAYVVFLILINGVAFLILMGCYLKMYCAIRGSQAWNSNDSRIAKRMALLVFTDFVCWAPIAFFSLTAVFGLQLISLEEAKVFTIFVLPLNSCANPFLYAIFTKQFKKDCVLICKRIEESRVTRGIGRCRHSSNFSNRHTPANTNSAAERKSGGPGLTAGGGMLAGVNSGSEPLACMCHITKQPDRRTLFGTRRGWKALALRYLFCQDQTRENSRGNDYTYAIAQIQKNMDHGHHKRASSISSENFSSRSDSWRQGNVPLRLLERANRRTSWSVTRKQSQDSNLSCSRQDSSTSTFRMSRSSVSSDANSGAARGQFTHSLRDRTAQGVLATGNTADGQAVPAGSPPPNTGRGVMISSLREKPVFTSEGAVSRLTRGIMSVSKDKPKLCRQGAVDDCAASNRGAAVHGRCGGIEMRPFPQKSPPYGTAAGLIVRGPAGTDLCPACARKETSPPLTFKSKELEEKFTCFYNRLAETSNEESSEVSTSKDEHVIVSTDQSTAEGGHGDSKDNPDATTSSTATTTTVTTTASINFREDGECVEEPLLPTSVSTTFRESEAADRVPPMDRLPVSRQSDGSRLERLHVSEENVRAAKSSSTTSLRDSSPAKLEKKTVSENSLKKLSLRSLPAAILRSLSSQSPRSKTRSKLELASTSAAGPSRLRKNKTTGSAIAVTSTPPVPSAAKLHSSKSEVALASLNRPTSSNFSDWRNAPGRSVSNSQPQRRSGSLISGIRGFAEDDSESEGDDVFLDEDRRQYRMSIPERHRASISGLPSMEAAQRSSVRTSEDAPLMEQQELEQSRRRVT